MNNPENEKSTNYSMTFNNKPEEEQNSVEEIIEINQGDEQNCEDVEKDCGNCSQFCLENDGAKDKIAKDYGENASVDEYDFLRNEFYDYLQKNGYIESFVEISKDNDITEEAMDDDLNITEEDQNIKDDNKLEANLLSKEQTESKNEYNTLQEEKYYPNKVSVIDILSKLKEISNKIK